MVTPVITQLASSPLWKWKARRGVNLSAWQSMIVLATTAGSLGSLEVSVMILPWKSMPSGDVT